MSKSPIVMHVNQHVIRKNKATGAHEAPLVVRRKSRSAAKAVYCNSADIYVGGLKIGSLVYHPDHPLDCGARVWLELDPTHACVVPDTLKDENE